MSNLYALFSNYNWLSRAVVAYLSRSVHYKKLRELLSIGSYDLLKEYYRGWVEKSQDIGDNSRDDKRSKSIAVGSKGFIEKMKFSLGAMAKGQKSLKTAEAYQLRDPFASYSTHFDVKNEDIGTNNAYYWNMLIPLAQGDYSDMLILCHDL